MSIAPVTVMSRAEAEERYAALVRTIGDMSAFRERALAFALDAEELATYDDLLELEFLLER